MGCAAANLIKKTRKEKKKRTDRKSEEVEWERHSAPPCCPVLSWPSQTEKCQSFARQPLAAALLHVKHPGCLILLSFSSDMLLDHQYSSTQMKQYFLLRVVGSGVALWPTQVVPFLASLA